MAKDFITKYLKMQFDTESPVPFHKWCVINLLGAAMGRRVWTEFATKVYPNTFVILVGPPGITRKSSAMGAARKILDEAPITVAADTITKERLFEVIDEAHIPEYDERNVIIHSGEFSNLLAVDPAGMLNFLTSAFNADQDKMVYETKRSGKNEMENYIISLLGATTPSWMSNEYPSQTMQDGFSARVIFVYADKKEKSIPFRDAESLERSRTLLAELKDDLAEIVAKCRGQMLPTDGFIEKYRNYYAEWNHQAQLAPPSLSSFLGRKDVHVQKLSMIFALSRGSMRINVTDLDNSMAVLRGIEDDLELVFQGVGTNRLQPIKMTIINQVQENGELPVAHFHDSLSNAGNFDEIEKSIEQAIAAERIEEVRKGGRRYLRIPMAHKDAY